MVKVCSASMPPSLRAHLNFSSPGRENMRFAVKMSLVGHLPVHDLGWLLAIPIDFTSGAEKAGADIRSRQASVRMPAHYRTTERRASDGGRAHLRLEGELR